MNIKSYFLIFAVFLMSFDLGGQVSREVFATWSKQLPPFCQLSLSLSPAFEDCCLQNATEELLALLEALFITHNNSIGYGLVKFLAVRGLLWEFLTNGQAAALITEVTEAVQSLKAKRAPDADDSYLNRNHCLEAGLEALGGGEGDLRPVLPVFILEVAFCLTKKIFAGSIAFLKNFLIILGAENLLLLLRGGRLREVLEYFTEVFGPIFEANTKAAILGAISRDIAVIQGFANRTTYLDAFSVAPFAWGAGFKARGGNLVPLTTAEKAAVTAASRGFDGLTRINPPGHSDPAPQAASTPTPPARGIGGRGRLLGFWYRDGNSHKQAG